MFELSRHTLSNGLRLVHHHDPQTVMASMNMLYNVGSRNERPSLTGIAHLFEHLMFGGSANIPDFDGVIDDAGGENNAWTSNDFTSFQTMVPAQNIETMMYAESDRMLALDFGSRALEVQRSVVIEEFKQTCLNRPYGNQMHLLRQAFYGDNHPYSWPTIGITPDHIAAVTRHDVEQWFYSHYAPNNAILATVGNVDADTVFRLAERWFGSIPRRDIAPMPDMTYRPLDAPVVVRSRQRVPNTLVTIAWPMDGYGTPDYRTADAITDVLSAGQASRMFRQLVVQNPLFSSADASIFGSEGPGILLMSAVLNDPADSAADDAVNILTDMGRQLASSSPVSQYELDRAANRYRSQRLFANFNHVPRAQNIALAEFHGEDINRESELYHTITTHDITRVAHQIFNQSNPAIVIITPDNSNA